MNKHDVDAVSLGFGVAFLAVVAWWLVARLIEVDLPGLGWFAAAGLIVLGVLGLFAATRPAAKGR
jgi:hypothetical protein